MRSCGEAFLVAFLALARAPASGKSKILKGTIMLGFGTKLSRVLSKRGADPLTFFHFLAL
jgi:hypothetical protein